MNDPHQDDCHDDQLSQLYQQSRMEEPPMSLDSAILTQARKVVEKPEKKRIWNRIGWMVPLASTAIILLTATLVIQMKAEHPELMTQAVVMDAAPIAEPEMLESENEVAAQVETALPVKAALEKKAVGAVTAKQAPVSSARLFERPSMESADQVPRASRTQKPQSHSPPVRQSRSAPPSLQSDRMVSDMMDAELEASGSAQTGSKINDELSIDAQLKQIRELIVQKKIDEAQKSLDGFRKAYPGFILPKDITDALK